MSQNARSLIEDSSNEVFLSICSLWEMAIKLSIGKLNLAQPFEVLIPEQMSLNRIELLPIEIGHTLLITRLPFHHRDPFDRMLIAQAIVEELPILGVDPAFDAYPVERFW